jgi:hypothetical protein
LDEQTFGRDSVENRPAHLVYAIAVCFRDERGILLVSKPLE